MKKILIIASTFIFFFSCSKNHVQNSDSPIVGEWVIRGGYVNGRIDNWMLIVNSYEGYIFKSGGSLTGYNSDSSLLDIGEAYLRFSGSYSIMKSKQIINSNGIQFTDSIIMNGAPRNIIFPHYYYINKDTLFFYFNNRECFAYLKAK